MGEVTPTAFVSWAHQSRDWTPEQAQIWEKTVRQFADALRLAGVDADIDLYHYSDPDIDWTRYGTKMIEEKDTTIIALSAAWAERWRGANPPDEGAGAAREADALHGRFDEDQQRFQGLGEDRDLARCLGGRCPRRPAARHPVPDPGFLARIVGRFAADVAPQAEVPSSRSRPDTGPVAGGTGRATRLRVYG